MTNFAIFSGNKSCQQLKSANPQHVHEFFTQNFFDNFFVKSKLLTAKMSKTEAFSRVFTQNNSTIFLGKSKLNLWTKNEDFEQCEQSSTKYVYTMRKTLFETV